MTPLAGRDVLTAEPLEWTMLSFAVAILAQAIQPGPNAPVDADGNRFDWVALPSAREALACQSRLPSGFEGRIVLQCRSAPKDRVTNCVVVANTAAHDPKIEKMAVCTAERSFRIRVVSPRGETVTGTSLSVPVQLRARH